MGLFLTKASGHSAYSFEVQAEYAILVKGRIFYCLQKLFLNRLFWTCKPDLTWLWLGEAVIVFDAETVMGRIPPDVRF
jgi:hypothetical protein